MNNVGGVQKLERAKNVVENWDDMFFCQNRSKLYWRQHFLDIRFYVFHDQEKTKFILTVAGIADQFTLDMLLGQYFKILIKDNIV